MYPAGDGKCVSVDRGSYASKIAVIEKNQSKRRGN